MDDRDPVQRPTGLGYGASRDVPVAEFLYRHEAEFAAGFLDSAGIPYRLQVDDAGGIDAGVTISRPAVLWVRPDDVDEARELLELEGNPASTIPLKDQPSMRRSAAPDGRPGQRNGPSERLVRLCGVERAVAAGLSVLLVGLAAGLGGRGPDGVSLTMGVLLVLGAALALSALLGRTLPSLKALLRAMSGVAP